MGAQKSVNCNRATVGLLLLLPGDDDDVSIGANKRRDGVILAVSRQVRHEDLVRVNCVVARRIISRLSSSLV